MLAIHSLTDIYLVGRKEKKSWRDVSFFYWTALVKQRSELFSIILRKDRTWSWSRILQWMTFRGSFDLVTNKITQIHLHAELHSHCWKVVSNSRWVLLKECNMKLVVFCSFNTHRCPLSVIDWHWQMRINRRRLKQVSAWRISQHLGGKASTQASSWRRASTVILQPPDQLFLPH